MKSGILILLLATIGCSSGDKKNGPRYEHVSKVYVSQDCYGSKAVCYEDAINLAKKDCEKDNRIYEYENHEVTPTISLRYRCKWLVEDSKN